ncbi:hypothetical protein MKZ38_003068 [Zalerion maritima]|uniref:Uncharacterized protein n=1 Tax=Zalerion maritima TaxID=339359 RepID=A0AAD5RPK1_9PEZI|nr:hypothetical protein MKZ38_003068 [Zalerion maritima]
MFRATSDVVDTTSSPATQATARPTTNIRGCCAFRGRSHEHSNRSSTEYTARGPRSFDVEHGVQADFSPQERRRRRSGGTPDELAEIELGFGESSGSRDTKAGKACQIVFGIVEEYTTFRHSVGRRGGRVRRGDRRC